MFGVLRKVNAKMTTAVMEQLFCISCGNGLVPTAKFCGKCGQSRLSLNYESNLEVVSTTSPVQVQPSEVKYQAPAQPTYPAPQYSDVAPPPITAAPQQVEPNPEPVIIAVQAADPAPQAVTTQVQPRVQFDTAAEPTAQPNADKQLKNESSSRGLCVTSIAVAVFSLIFITSPVGSLIALIAWILALSSTSGIEAMGYWPVKIFGRTINLSKGKKLEPLMMAAVLISCAIMFIQFFVNIVPWFIGLILLASLGS